MGPDMVPQLLGLVFENFVSPAVLVEVMPVLEPAGAKNCNPGAMMRFLPSMENYSSHNSSHYKGPVASTTK